MQICVTVIAPSSGHVGLTKTANLREVSGSENRWRNHILWPNVEERTLSMPGDEDKVAAEVEAHEVKMKAGEDELARKGEGAGGAIANLRRGCRKPC
jgi:hypothetical protein